MPEKKATPSATIQKMEIKRALFFFISIQKSLCSAFFTGFTYHSISSHRSRMRVPGYVRDLAVLDADDFVRHGGQSGVMSDDDHGHPLLPAHILQKFQDRLTGLVIQSARRLVAEKKLGILGKGSCDRNPLLLPAGKLRRKIPEPAFQVPLPSAQWPRPAVPCRSEEQAPHSQEPSDWEPDCKTERQNRYPPCGSW